jgi:hypothetical protein
VDVIGRAAAVNNQTTHVADDIVIQGRTGNSMSSISQKDPAAYVGSKVTVVHLSLADDQMEKYRGTVSLNNCAVDTSDIGDPLTASGLQSLVSKYLWTTTCSGKLRSSLERIFARETRADRWAAPLEGRVRASAAELSGVTIAGECHTSLCRYDVTLAESGNRGNQLFSFDRKVISSVKNTELAVDSVHFGVPSRYRTYFYSTVVPAAFVKPLRQLMEGSHSELE